MEHDDDPERRIAELERSHGRPFEQPPAYPRAPQQGWQQTWNPYSPAPQPGWQQPQAWQQQPQSWPPPGGHAAYGAGLHATPQPPLGGKSRGKSRLFSAVVAGLVVLVLAAFAVHNVYAYVVGTPATATVTFCSHAKKHSYCNGTWKIDGGSQTGRVRGGGFGLDKGSVVDVRVHDGIAYTLGNFALSLGGLGVGLPLLLFWQIRKRRRRE